MSQSVPTTTSGTQSGTETKSDPVGWVFPCVFQADSDSPPVPLLFSRVNHSHSDVGSDEQSGVTELFNAVVNTVRESVRQEPVNPGKNLIEVQADHYQDTKSKVEQISKVVCPGLPVLFAAKCREEETNIMLHNANRYLNSRFPSSGTVAYHKNGSAHLQPVSVNQTTADPVVPGPPSTYESRNGKEFSVAPSKSLIRSFPCVFRFEDAPSVFSAYASYNDAFTNLDPDEACQLKAKFESVVLDPAARYTVPGIDVKKELSEILTDFSQAFRCKVDHLAKVNFPELSVRFPDDFTDRALASIRTLAMQEVEAPPLTLGTMAYYKDGGIFLQPVIASDTGKGVSLR